MTIPDLITDILGCLRNQFYADRIREFMRDERALTKAIARYGYDCAQRGWDFSVLDIKRDLLDLLNQIKRTGSPIKYLPTYLEGAVTRHIGQRAEELQAAARKNKTPKAVQTVVSGVKPVVVIQPDNTEILSALYRDIKRINKAQRAERTERGSVSRSNVKDIVAAAKQEALL